MSCNSCAMVTRNTKSTLTKSIKEDRFLLLSCPTFTPSRSRFQFTTASEPWLTVVSRLVPCALIAYTPTDKPSRSFFGAKHSRPALATPAAVWRSIVVKVFKRSTLSHTVANRKHRNRWNAQYISKSLRGTPYSSSRQTETPPPMEHQRYCQKFHRDPLTNAIAIQKHQHH